MPSVVFAIICVCWWVVLGVITAPSFVQVTVVAGPPVEVQVRVLDSLSNVSSVTLGAPAGDKQRIKKLYTLLSPYSYVLRGVPFFTYKKGSLKGHFSILYITIFSSNINTRVHNIVTITLT